MPTGPSGRRPIRAHSAKTIGKLSVMCQKGSVLTQAVSADMAIFKLW